MQKNFLSKQEVHKTIYTSTLSRTTETAIVIIKGLEDKTEWKIKPINQYKRNSL